MTTLWLRIANLGYSDYQGDEIKALAQPALGQSWLEFIFEQRKGPLQFLVARVIAFIHPSGSNEGFSRLPFALAGALAVLIFYALLRLHTDRRTALFAALIMATNGLFIGLTRIVQYQALALLFSCLALYAFSLAIYNPSWKIAGIYAGFASWMLALLSHYDSVLIAPFVIYLLYRWYRDIPKRSITSMLWKVGLPVGTGLAISIGFYIFLLLSASGDTKVYWLGRLMGDGITDVISSSIVTFQLYNPLFVLPIYIVLGLCSIPKIRQALPFWGWFLFAWIVMELVVDDPGTHIYTYILPACVILGFGLGALIDTIQKIIPGRIGSASGLAVPVLLFCVLFGLSNFIFVDHTPEYPWEARGFLFWKIERPSGEYKLWLFGFPYFRHWEEIGAFVASYTGDKPNYLSNEKETIADYYLPPLPRSGDPEIYIHIYHPQSFIERLANEKIRYWTKNYPPVRTFENGGQVVAEIYLLPSGTLEDIRAAGY